MHGERRKPAVMCDVLTTPGTIATRWTKMSLNLCKKKRKRKGEEGKGKSVPRSFDSTGGNRCAGGARYLREKKGKKKEKGKGPRRGGQVP